jgi:restriction endonuclease S subunit
MTSVEKVKIPEGYKQTEVGVIPEDWDCLESREAMNFIGGYGFSSSLATTVGVKWLKIANVGLNEIKWDAESFLPEKLINDYKDFLLKPSDVVMALTRPILNDSLKVARISEADIPALLNQRVAKIDPKSYHQLDYLYYVVQRLNFVAAMNLAMAGTDPPNIGTNALAKIKIVAPATKQEQTAIANALSDVDNLIASLETLIAKKSAIKTAAMQQLLTGKKRLPTFVKESEKRAVKESEQQGAKQSSELDSTSETAQAAETKQTSTLNSDLYKESGEGLDSKSNQQSEVGNANNKQIAPRPGYKQTELGEIPEDWEVKALGDLGKFKNGVNKDGDSFGFGQPFINLMDVFGKTAIKGDEKLGLINSTELDRKEYDLRTGDVLFIRSSVKPSGVGLTAVVLRDLENTIYSGFLIRYRSLAALNLQFKQFCFHEAGFRKRIVAASSVSANTNINQDSLKQLLLAYPSDTKEQTAIANVLSEMDTELDSLQQRLSKTQKIKQGMMQELLTGKTRLV